MTDWTATTEQGLRTEALRQIARKGPPMPTSSADLATMAAEIAAAVAAGNEPPAEQLAAYRAATEPKKPAGRTPLRNFRASDDLWQLVTVEAARLNWSPSEVLRDLISTHLANR